jgi:Divergent InlB B-repeat domain
VTRVPRILLTLAIVVAASFAAIPAASASPATLPATMPVNTGMVDLPGADISSNTVGVRTLAQVGNDIWAGGRFNEIDDLNGNKLMDAAELAAFDDTTGAPDLSVHTPIVTSSTGDPEVYASSLGPDGNLYFAGIFDAVDGVARHNVAAIDPRTGLLLPFAPVSGNATAILATGDAVYVGTNRIQSFLLNGIPTPGFSPPTVFTDASLRVHYTPPQFRDITELDGTLVATCQCDSLADANGVRNVKAVVEIDATTGNWVNWAPARLVDSSAAFGLSLIIHNYPGTSAPTVYVAAGGSDFTAAYDFVTGTQRFKTDTSGSSQTVAWYQGSLIVGGHFEWTQSPTTSSCGDNKHPITTCYYTPKLVAMNASTGAVILDGTGAPWNPGICCKYNGVWALMPDADGATLHVGGEFTQVGGVWTCQSFDPICLSGSVLQKFYARFPGPASATQTLTVAQDGGGAGTVTSNPSGVSCGLTCITDYATGTTVTLTAAAGDNNTTFTGWSSNDPGFNCPGTDTCTVTMSVAHTVTATFSPISFQLNLTKVGAGTGTVTSAPAGIVCGALCSRFFVQYSTVTLSAAAGANSIFTGWGGDCTGTGTCQVTMDQAHNVTATFDTTLTNLAVTKTGPGQGSVTSSPSGLSCGGLCSKGFSTSTVTLTATSAGGSAFNGWSSADAGFSCPGTGPCTVTLDMARTVLADFEHAKTLSVTVTGGGGGNVTSVPTGLNCTSGTCSAGFVSGSTAALTATPDATSVFTGWSANAACSGSAGCVLTAAGTAAQRSVTATFVPAQSLTVSPAGTGAGTITSSPAGIGCGLVCQSEFATGTIVTLTATPDANSVFTGWSGTGVGCPGTGTCQVTMNSTLVVTATFVPVQRQLTVAVSGHGSVSSNPAGVDCGTGTSGTCGPTFQHGSDVELDANPGASWMFVGWGGACNGTDLTCVVTMNGAQSVTATFAPTANTVNVDLDGSGTGQITSDIGGIVCPDACSAAFQPGDVVTLSAAADPGSVFGGWSGACTNTSGDCVLTAGAGQSVTADFDPQNTLTVGTSGSGSVTSDTGGIDCPDTSCSAVYPLGTAVTLTANADGGAVLAGWSGACSGIAPTCVVTMNGPHAATATFVDAQTLSVGITGGGTGSVSSSPPGISCATGNTGTCIDAFVQGTTVVLTATPDANSVFTGWTGGGCDGTTAPCQVTMSTDVSVSADFAPTYPLTVQTVGNGSVTSSPAGISCPGVCSVTLVSGTVVTLTATPVSGWAFSGWSGACSGSGVCQVTMSAATGATATFAQNPLTTIDDNDPAIAYNGWAATLDATANGGAYRSSVVTADKLTWVSPVSTTFTWVTRVGPDRGIAGVTIDGVAQPNVDLYAATPGSSSKTYAGLANQAHTVVIKVTGKKNGASTGKGVALDAFVVGATTVQESDPSVVFDTWKSAAQAKAYGGRYRSAAAATASVSVTFTGTSIDWIAATGTVFGKASVTIDGVPQGTVDLYTAAPHWKVPFTFGGLSAGPHTMVIQVLGQKNASSTGTKVIIDGFTIHA